ncbi:MAG: hypothetical protein KatS3mg009_1620 [Acidimicrobiia bacterium]|nr:MAG: hypothetical protein KatS3mg009_1620 [Acidimicrobiia bacterium]
MRAHSTGQYSTSGRSAITMPPEWMPRWRGKSITSDASASASGGIGGGRVAAGSAASGSRASITAPSRHASRAVRSNRRTARAARPPGRRGVPVVVAAAAARSSPGASVAVSSANASGPAAQRSTHLPSASARPGGSPTALAISRNALRGR